MTNAEIILTAAVILTPILSLVVSIIVARRNKDKDTKQEGLTLGKMQSDLEYIREGIDELKKSEKNHDEKLDVMSDRLTKVETSLEDHIKNRHIHVPASKGAKRK